MKENLTEKSLTFSTVFVVVVVVDVVLLILEMTWTKGVCICLHNCKLYCTSDLRILLLLHM